MATKVEAARERLHDQDFYAWTRQQAALLRAKRFTALDLDRLVEAVEEMGDSQREAALGNARVVLEHLLVLAHSAAQDPRNGWRAHPTRAPRPARVLDSPQLRQALHDKPALVSAIAHRNGEGALAITASRSRSRGGKGYGFVEFSSSSAAEKATREMAGVELRGRRIIVRPARVRLRS